MKKKVLIEEELYKKIAISDLILFGIHSITSANRECRFATLVHKCFELFPKVFCLSGYSKWPDTRKLDRPLRSLRDQNLITGNPKSMFSLTKKGRKRALEVANLFRQKKLL